MLKNVEVWVNMNGYFTGRFEFSIDTKGRMSFPAKFREMLGENEILHLIRIPKFRIKILPESEWEKKAEIYSNLPETEEFDEYRRTFYYSQADSELDVQGRITIPKKQLEEIKYKGGKITLVGMGKYIEVFCSENENVKIEEDADEKTFSQNYYNIEKKIAEFEEK